MFNIETAVNGVDYFLPPGRPFSFDPENQQFIVGDEPQVFKTRLADTEDIFGLDLIMSSSVRERPLVGEDLLMIGPWSFLIQMPALRNWIVNLTSKDRQRIETTVEKVMIGVYKTLSPEIEPPKKSRTVNRIDIRAECRSNGLVYLQTFGDCACLKPDSAPELISYPENYSFQTSKDFPVGYTMHNTLLPVHRLSLYSGFGALAWLARK